MNYSNSLCFLLNCLLIFITATAVHGENNGLISKTHSEPVTDDDICICPAIYQPICGSDGKTYGNGCELDCIRKKNPFAFGLCKGECPCCKEPFYNDPFTFQEESGFWGWDIKTGSHHQIKSQSEKSEKVSSCYQQVAVPDCPCILLYKPVCGSDGHTYGNDCDLGCQQRVRPCIKKACDGECPCCNGPCPSKN